MPRRCVADTVAVFPASTTWSGVAAGRFRRAAFLAALDAEVPARPVGITLRRDGRSAPEAAFVGGQHLLSSIGCVLCLFGLVRELTVLPLMPSVGDRAELARRAAASTAGATGSCIRCSRCVRACRVPVDW